MQMFVTKQIAKHFKPFHYRSNNMYSDVSRCFCGCNTGHGPHAVEYCPNLALPRLCTAVSQNRQMQFSTDRVLVKNLIYKHFHNT